jgi:hypothetical protein
MIGHDEKVERLDQPDRLTGRGDDLLALGEAQRVIGTDRVADHARIRRIGRVQVGIAEEDPAWICLKQIRRVLRRSDAHIVFGGGDILCHDSRACERRQRRDACPDRTPMWFSGHSIPSQFLSRPACRRNN